MERDFQSNFEASDSSYNAVFSDGTLESLIPVSTYSSSSSFNFFSEDFPALTHKSQLVDNSDSQLNPFNFNFKTPKNEPFTDSQLSPFIDFFSDSPFNHLPQLTDHSTNSSSSSSTTRKRGRVDSPQTTTPTPTLDSILLQNTTYNFPKNPIPHSELARQRRQKISDKTRCLQKLMPWDKKMDTATMLEEAYKYVRFLQAQITALQSMPCHSSFTTTTVNGSQNDGRFVAGLVSLNRQQLLQVLVNSPVAQTMLYSQGFCVFSMEQLVLLKKVEARNKAVLQQQLLRS